MNKAALILLIILSFALIAVCFAGNITVTVSYDAPEAGDIYLKIYQHRFRANTEKTDYERPDIWTEKAQQTIKLDASNQYKFTDLDPAQYFFYAWLDSKPNETPDLDPPEPTGWYSSDFGRMEPVIIDDDAEDFEITIQLYKLKPFPKQELEIKQSSFSWKKGYPVLHLKGKPEELGFAHGYLIAPQIVDFFQFFILEDQVRSATRYREKIYPMLKERFSVTPDHQKELKAVIKGMKKRGTDIFIEPLEREMDWIDILAINAYGEFWMDRLACTQGVFWGKMTEESELKGGLITGRNMDGECDIRKSTVMHFLIFAFEPEGKKRWISFKWPGYIGTYTGINEDGIYCMLNYGSRKTGPKTTGHTPVTFIQRAILEEVSPDNMIEDSQKIFERFRCSGGGSCGAPAVIFLASPYVGQEHPAVVYEGNRFGEAFRYPGESPTFSPYNLVGSNHFFKYGVSYDEPGQVFGQTPYFSSRCRARIAISKATVWERTDHPVGTAEVVDFVKSLAAGYTEHSIIFRPNEMTFDVSNDNLKFDHWDAPYLDWTTFRFEEIFE